ncbi:hypothetical protein AAC387_Pa03g0831 [Persea americana]
MRASSKALGALIALILTQILICSQQSLPFELKTQRERTPPRKLLLLSIPSSTSANLKNLNEDVKKSKKAVEASLRNIPPSVPNPTQNK